MAIAWPVHHDGGAFEGDEAGGELLAMQIVEEWEDAIAGVDDLDDDGEMLGEVPSGFVEQALGTEAEDAFEDGGAGQAVMGGGFEDSLVGGGEGGVVAGS